MDSNFGGGVYVTDAGTSLIVTNMTISNTNAGSSGTFGFYLTANTNANLTNVILVDSKSDLTGAIYAYGATVGVRGCHIARNYGLSM